MHTPPPTTPGADGPPTDTPPPADPQPWEQQPGESDLMYGRFRRFLDEPAETRRLVDIAEKLVAEDHRDGVRRPPTVASLITVAGRWKWKMRARAWDEHHNQQAEAQHTDTRTQVIARQLAFADKVCQRVEQELDQLPFGKATHTELARWWDVAVKIERQALGLDRHLVEMSGPNGKPIEVSLDGLDPDARRAELAELLAEAQRRAAALGRANDDDAD